MITYSDIENKWKTYIVRGKRENFFKHKEYTAIRFFPLKEDCRIKVRKKALVCFFASSK